MCRRMVWWKIHPDVVTFGMMIRAGERGGRLTSGIRSHSWVGLVENFFKGTLWEHSMYFDLSSFQQINFSNFF